MARRTTDLIAIALIAAAGLVVARRLVVWWKTEPPTVGQPTGSFTVTLSPWGAGANGVDLAFGDQPIGLHRETVAGKLDQALARLQQQCREHVSRGAADQFPPVSAEETRLLARLVGQTAVESDLGGRWSIYRLPGPLAMVFGVASPSADDSAPRVLCWGLAYPLGPEAWTALLVTPRSANGSEAGTSAEPALPPGSTRLMSVSDGAGGGLVTFQGVGPAEAWQSWLDGQAALHGWKVLADWQAGPASRSAAWSDGARRIDVQLTKSDEDWGGLISKLPLPPEDRHP